MAYLHVNNVFLDFEINVDLSLKKDFINFASSFMKKKDHKFSIYRALNDINLEINNGDRLGIIGPNGAGKTTLLKILAGIYEPTSGTCKSEGSITSLINLGIGIHPELTGYENIITQLLMNGIRKNKAEKMVPDIAKFSELESFLDMPIKAYSSGMLMRLCFSIATSMDPAILLMDEWLSTGDYLFIEKAKTRVGEMLSRAKIVVFGSHDLSLVQEICNKAIYINKGKIVSYGTPDNVINVYKTLRAGQ